MKSRVVLRRFKGEFMKTVLVTGGAGFIGSAFVRRLLNKSDYRVVVADKLTYAANTLSLEPFKKNKNFVFCQVDICNKRAIAKLFACEKPDMIVNFAAETHVDRSFKYPALFTKTNVSGTQVLLDCCKNFGVNRFHQVSTDEVYGGVSENEIIHKNYILSTEQSPLNPTNPYSATKAAADILALVYGKSYGLHVTVTRSTNNYGEWQNHEKLIPAVIKNALLNKKVKVYGAGQDVRDWLYVDDNCAAIELVLKFGKSGDIYNVSGKNRIKNLDLIKTVLQLLGKSESLIKFVPGRVSNDFCYMIDDEKISRELNFAPQTDFAAGLKKTVNFYKNYFGISKKND